MKILVTGATGYIGQRLIPVLLQQGHTLVCCVRDRNRFDLSRYPSLPIEVIETDLLRKETLEAIPNDIDAAYYLVHSMSTGNKFKEMEATSARNFADRMGSTHARQVIYLGGIANAAQLSEHLSSRKEVEDILKSGKVPVTALRAGIIVGSGSASFEIIRDLVEKLPVMIAPKWLATRTQPLGIRDVIAFLSGVLLRPETLNNSYDLYGPDILTYKEMLLQFAEVRGLKRKIITVPVMTPKLSGYWLYFVTSTSYSLASNLVDSMKIEVIAEKNGLAQLLGIQPMSYKEAIKIAFGKIEQNLVISTWKDALTSTILARGVSAHIAVPEYGCYTDVRERPSKDPEKSVQRIFAIGGQTGWYYGRWMWEFRGFLDKLFGGVGLRRGRKNGTDISAGETLDFWRVLYASKTEKRLLLYAEMKLPGEAWLEFRITDDMVVHQTATFRPLGLWGRLYWYAVLPFHAFIFNGMISKIAD